MRLQKNNRSGSRKAQQAMMDEMFGWSEETKRTTGGARQAKINMMNRLFHGEGAEGDSEESESSEKVSQDTLKNTKSHDTLSATGVGQKKRCMCQGCRVRRAAKKPGIKLDSNHWRTQPRDEQGRWTEGGGYGGSTGGASMGPAPEDDVVVIAQQENQTARETQEHQVSTGVTAGKGHEDLAAEMEAIAHMMVDALYAGMTNVREERRAAEEALATPLGRMTQGARRYFGSAADDQVHFLLESGFVQALGFDVPDGWLDEDGRGRHVDADKLRYALTLTMADAIYSAADGTDSDVDVSGAVGRITQAVTTHFGFGPYGFGMSEGDRHDAMMRYVYEQVRIEQIMVERNGEDYMRSPEENALGHTPANM